MSLTKAERRDRDWDISRERARDAYVDSLYRAWPRVRAKPDVFLFDLDGTTADVRHRDPLDASRCDEDPPNPVVVAVAKALQAAQYGLVFMTGRQEEAKRRTHQFLIWQGLTEYLKLVTRRQGDPRPDAIVKVELYREHVEPFFNVIGVFDDRNSVVAAWRSIGLTVFQVDNRAD